MPLSELGPTVVSHLRDAFYITVGLGVIGVTNLRDQLERPTLDTGALTGAVDALGERLDTVVTGIDERLAAVEARLDQVLDQVTDGLPDPARDVVTNARGAAKEARAQLRSLGGRAA